MIRKSIKYLIIVTVNLLILTVLLWFWTDSIEITFNDWVRPVEFIKLLGITLISIVAIRISISIYRKLEINSKNKKLILSALLTVLISSYFYIDYSRKIYQNKFQNLEVRKNLERKIEPMDEGPLGTKAEDLTFEEYKEISKTNWFPKIQKEARNINYSYSYDGFLPDYSLEIRYDIPLNSKIDSSTMEYGKIHIDTIKDLKRITYNEYVD